MSRTHRSQRRSGIQSRHLVDGMRSQKKAKKSQPSCASARLSGSSAKSSSYDDLLTNPRTDFSCREDDESEALGARLWPEGFSRQEATHGEAKRVKQEEEQ